MRARKGSHVNADVERWKATLLLRQSSHNRVGKEGSAVKTSKMENCKGRFVERILYGAIREV